MTVTRNRCTRTTCIITLIPFDAKICLWNGLMAAAEISTDSRGCRYLYGRTMKVESDEIQFDKYENDIAPNNGGTNRSSFTSACFEFYSIFDISDIVSHVRSISPSPSIYFSFCIGFGCSNRLQMQKHAKIISTPFNERKPCRHKHIKHSHSQSAHARAEITSASASRRVYPRNVRLHNVLLHTCVLFVRNKHEKTTKIQPNTEPQCGAHIQIHMHTHANTCSTAKT